jgi:hypothetical protein
MQNERGSDPRSPPKAGSAATYSAGPHKEEAAPRAAALRLITPPDRALCCRRPPGIPAARGREKRGIACRLRFVALQMHASPL